MENPTRASVQNTSQKQLNQQEVWRVTPQGSSLFARSLPSGQARTKRVPQAAGPARLLVFCFLSVFLANCGPRYTYPAGTVPKSIEEICQKEYKIQTKVQIIGKTLGALVSLDPKNSSAKDINDLMGKVLQVMTRVALSTDQPIDYCTIILRDPSKTSEYAITRSLDDTRRANADMIGVEESINRTLFGQNRYLPNETTPHLFILKDIRKEDFLSEQMVQRIRFNFVKDMQEDPNQKKKTEGEEVDLAQSLVLVDGTFDTVEGRRLFHISVIALKAYDPKQLVLDIFKIVNAVLQGYQFTDFDAVEIQDYLNRQKLVLDREVIANYQKKKITDAELLDQFLVESQSIQEAFKLFGFNVGPEGVESQEPVMNSSPSH